MKRIYICFPEGKNKVFTLSYDDGKNADKRLVEIFNKSHIVKLIATFLPNELQMVSSSLSTFLALN